MEGDTLYFARGDINSAGATRLRAGLAAVQRAVGWRRGDDGGLVGRFIGALADRGRGVPILERIRSAAQKGYQENEADPELRVNDAVDIADFLFTTTGDAVTAHAIADDVELVLAVPGSRKRKVRVLERRSTFTLRLDIDGAEYPAVLGLSEQDPAVRLRLRNTVATVAICLLEIPIDELKTLLAEIREENDRSPEDALDVLGFLRHIADIVLEDHVKQPAKIELALGTPYDARRFVRSFRLEDIREGYPGLFYEAVHSDLLEEEEEADLDRQLVEVLGRTMLSSARPQR